MSEFDRLTSAFDKELDSFDFAVRKRALKYYASRIADRLLVCRPQSHDHNLHCHTFFSYNCFGWSPTHVALASKLLGFQFSGMVDFDVLDGVDEFLDATKMLSVPSVAAMETRVFISALADKEINSPGEPGVAYHVGLGFKSSRVPESARAFATDLAKRANSRTRTVVQRVNAAIADVALDFDREVMPLTPAGNPTERHVCSAYRKKAEQVFGSSEKALAYWQKVLGLDDATASSAASSLVVLEGLIRAKLMKRGGPGYIVPDAATFPPIEEMNRFVKQCGAIPCIAWLNGFSAGEADPAALLAFHKSLGAEALLIIPDRNWNIKDAVKKEKSIANLFRVVDAAKQIGFPVIAGTELNTPGQKIVDDFNAKPLSQLVDCFLAGAAKVCS